MQNYLETDTKISFKKGMTLEQYMKQMKPEENDTTEDQIPLIQDNLYQTSLNQYNRSPSTKIIPFNIPQMDEDNYESSVDFGPETPVFNKYDQEILQNKQNDPQKEKYPKYNEIKITTMYNPKQKERTESRASKCNNKEYRIKHFSNSPYKKQQSLTPSKISLSKTLYGNSFLSNKSMALSTASSTLYQSKLNKLSEKLVSRQKQPGSKIIHSRESKNEKYFQQKNKRDIDNLIQYQNNIRLKYNSKINILDMKVQGLKDKLYERKNKLFQY